MTFQCSACGAPIGLDDIDFDNDVARCKHCRTAARLKPKTLGGGAASVIGDTGGTEAGEGKPGELTLPKKFQLAWPAGGMEVSWRWFKLQYIFLAVFCVFWDGFLLFWYGATGAGGAPIVFWLFPLAHVAVGVGLSYWTLAGLVNRTTLRVAQGQLAIEHGPIPWRGAKLPTSSLDQLFCKRHVWRGKQGVHYTYELFAVLGNGEQKKLLSGFDDVEQLLWLEHHIERVLGIQDRPVKGEVREKRELSH